MDTYVATFSVEVVVEVTGDYLNTEWAYEFQADSLEEANQIADAYGEREIFDDIMSEISIVPDLQGVEESE